MSAASSRDTAEICWAEKCSEPVARAYYLGGGSWAALCRGHGKYVLGGIIPPLARRSTETPQGEYGWHASPADWDQS